jgi:hypothetical protein
MATWRRLQQSYVIEVRRDYEQRTSWEPVEYLTAGSEAEFRLAELKLKERRQHNPEQHFRLNRIQVQTMVEEERK